MILYPAIDLKDGHCVRLLRGEMKAATIFSSSPADQAKSFEAAGFEWLHIVDLNGAFEGRPVNAQAVESILAGVNIPVQLGGGIRSMHHIEHWLAAGILRIILGTSALKQPALVRDACRIFPGKIAVGIDARNGKVAIEGWAKTTSRTALDLALEFEDAGIAALVYTDISRDGAMQGPNVEETAKLAEKLSTPVILSGGVTTLEDLKKIKAVEDCGIEGIILGRALYEKSIMPQEAFKVFA